MKSSPGLGGPGEGSADNDPYTPTPGNTGGPQAIGTADQTPP